jgi:hypothetical protein
MSEQYVRSGSPQPQGVGEDPLLHFTKLFIRFLQVVFHSFEKGSYRWDPDDQTTDIIISDIGTIGNDVVEKKPSIIVQRGQASWSNVSMNQFKSFNFETGATTHTDLIASSVVYNCMAIEGLEAQRLAWISSYSTRVLKRNLLRAGLHRVGENIEMGAESDASPLLGDSGAEVSLVPVMVPFFFQDTYSIGPVDNLLLKDVDLRLTSGTTAKFSAGTTGLRSPAIGGKVLKYDKTFSLTQRVSARAPTKRE